MQSLPFYPADILLPQGCDMGKWSVVACDQYSSEPEYWQRAEELVGDAPSTLHMILPEARLDGPDSQIAAINATMEDYWRRGVFQVYPQSFIYLERSLSSGQVRRGLIGMVDLEAYDYTPGSGAPIRATEGTVAERIPPRAKVRRDALLELPHVLLLMDDPADTVLQLAKAAANVPVYDFELMAQGGHIRGWQIPPEGTQAVLQSLQALQAASPLLFAVGDGNHSLATAKTCYEEQKAAHPELDLSNSPARYALVELENVHDPALEFEPIHRVVFGVQPEALLTFLRSAGGDAEGYPIAYITAQEEGTVYLPRALSGLEVGALQKLLDAYLSSNPGSIDYIHGEAVARRLGSQAQAIAFLLPPMDKFALFPGILSDGVLPRKTFSMGHANEKRFYLEGRRIRHDA